MSTERQQRILALKANQIKKGSEKTRRLLFLEAVSDGNLELIRIGLEKGVNPYQDVHEDGFGRVTAFEASFQPLKKEVWRLFLEFGFSFPENAIVQVAGYGRSDDEDIPFLLDNGVNGVDESLLDPIIVGGGNEDILRILLQHGANPNIKGQGGTTPLMVCVNYWDESRKSARLLLEFGADAKETDEKGQVVFDYAGTDAPAVKRFIRKYAKRS